MDAGEPISAAESFALCICCMGMRPSARYRIGSRRNLVVMVGVHKWGPGETAEAHENTPGKDGDHRWGAQKTPPRIPLHFLIGVLPLSIG